jgi:hypothetical protein
MVIMTENYPVITPVSPHRIKPELESGLRDGWNSSGNMLSRFHTPSSWESYHQTSFQCRSIGSERTALTMLGIVRDLANLSRQAAIVIDPVMENTGQGIKNIEALMFGKPVVSTWATLVITHRPAILRRADRISILF